MAPESKDSRITRIVLAALPRTLAIYGHGSFFGGRPRRESDLDLALLLPLGETPSPMTLAQLSGDLESATGNRVDISLLDLARQVVFCKEVVTSGSLIFVADPNAIDEFEMNTLSRYARLSEDRAPVLRSYAKEGVRE